jgi:hypothetical protein
MIHRLPLFILLLCTPAFADNGHLISMHKTREYNVAVFAEPWPPRVGELQLQFIVTDTDGQLVLDNSILPMQHRGAISLDTPGPFSLRYFLAGEAQPLISFDVLPKASVFVAYWSIWLFLIIGLIFIILREKLAKTHARRYPSL